MEGILNKESNNDEIEISKKFNDKNLRGKFLNNKSMFIFYEINKQVKTSHTKGYSNLIKESSPKIHKSIDLLKLAITIFEDNQFSENNNNYPNILTKLLDERSSSKNIMEYKNVLLISNLKERIYF